MTIDIYHSLLTAILTLVVIAINRRLRNHIARTESQRRQDDAILDKQRAEIDLLQNQLAVTTTDALGVPRVPCAFLGGRLDGLRQTVPISRVGDRHPHFDYLLSHFEDGAWQATPAHPEAARKEGTTRTSIS